MSDDPLAGRRSPPGYEILSVLGRGGMGVVVKARETASKSLVALKYLHRIDPDVRERFMREARLGTELHHPNIVAGRGVEFVDDAPVVVFDFFESTDLSAIIRRDTRLPQDRAVSIIRQILAGLDHAHRAGVVHRDLKSANVLISKDGIARLADFGVAHLRDSQERLTRTGAVLGTPAYMAPEQAEGAKIDERTDIYAAGVILFEMLTGTYPISGLSPIDMLTRVRVDVPLRITDIVPELDLRLSDIVARCLEKKPGDRFPSAEALLIAIDPSAKLAEKDQATLPDSPEGWNPAVGPTQDAGQTLTRPSRSTGRIRVLSGAIPVPGAVGGPAGVGPRSGVSRSTGKSAVLSKASISETIGGAAPAPAPRRRAWAAVAALCVLAAGGVFWRRAKAPTDPEATVAVARPLTVMNAADSGFLATHDEKLAFAFETDPPDELRAVVTSGSGQQSLTRVSAASSGSRQVFEAPAELLLEAFSVRFSRADGAPLSNGVLNHPGLLSVVDGWRDRLKLDPAGEVLGAPPGPRWAQQLDALERALTSASTSSFVKIATSAKRMDDVAAGSRAREMMLRAKKVVAPLFAAAPALLDLSDEVLPLKRRRMAYDALVPFRLLDRMLTMTGQSNSLLNAERATGVQFRAGPAAKAPAREITPDHKSIRLLCWGVTRGAAEDMEAFMGAAFEKDPPKLIEAWPISFEVGNGTGPARVDVRTRRSQGNQEGLIDDEVLWVTLPNRGWRLLITRANRAKTTVRKDFYERESDGLAVHHIDPALLETTTQFKVTREILPSPPAAITTDRRPVPLHIFRLSVWRD